MFDHVNWLAVVGAAFASFVFMAIWYTPLFGNRWARLHGRDPNNMQGPPLAPLLVISFAMAVLSATALAVIVTQFPNDAVTAAFVGGLVWVASGLVLKLNDLLFAQQPAGLFYIDGIGQLISLVLMAVIVSAFRA